MQAHCCPLAPNPLTWKLGVVLCIPSDHWTVTLSYSCRGGDHAGMLTKWKVGVVLCVLTDHCTMTLSCRCRGGDHAGTLLIRSPDVEGRRCAVHAAAGRDEGNSAGDLQCPPVHPPTARMEDRCHQTPGLRQPQQGKRRSNLVRNNLVLAAQTITDDVTLVSLAHEVSRSYLSTPWDFVLVL